MPETQPYVHLHVHSEYSILDGACRIDPLVARAAELGMSAVGLTDHGSMAGAVELSRAAAKAGVMAFTRCAALEAAQGCPMGAITVLDDDGNVLR